MTTRKEAISRINQSSHPLTHSKDLDKLIDKMGYKQVVMLGEATHGTHEFYTWRSAITQRLIKEKGFNFIAVEGDWPDCYRINLFVKGYSDTPEQAAEVLQSFKRWPTWMWANWEIAALAEWMRNYNATRRNDQKVGFYGLDVYSLWDSLHEIIRYLDKNDPESARYARQSASCFENYDGSDEGHSYALKTRLYPENCKNEVVNLLTEIRKRAASYNTDPEASFNTEQNARIAVNAERYYRAMGDPEEETWNIRDEHMMDTLNRLIDYHGTDTKCIVWEHNTHIGDARATPMQWRGLVNTGQLAREMYGNPRVALVGFGSYQGRVMAGKEWGAEMEDMELPEAKEDSWEEMIHSLDGKDRIIYLDEAGDFGRVPHRAVGVVYNPASERRGNYVPSQISKRYDAFVHIDKSKAVHAMHLRPDGEKIPETYPFRV